MLRITGVSLVLALVIGGSGCGGGHSTPQSPTPSSGPVSISAISPTSVSAGSSDLNLTIMGSNLAGTPHISVRARSSLPAGTQRYSRSRRVPEVARPQRYRLELLNGSIGTFGPGACQRRASKNFARRRCRRRARSRPHRLSGFPHSLERRRPRHPHPEASQSGVREVALVALRISLEFRQVPG